MNQSIARIKRESFSTTQVEGQAGKLNETAKLPYGAAFLKPAIDDNQLFLTGTGQREDDEEKKAGYAKRTVLKNQGGLASLLLLMGSDAFFFLYIFCIVIRPFLHTRRYQLSQTSERTSLARKLFCTMGSQRERKSGVTQM